MNTSSEAVADSNAKETQLDIEVLFRSHYGRVARIIARAVRDRARSEELAVEVFLKLWRMGPTAAPCGNTGGYPFCVPKAG